MHHTAMAMFHKVCLDNIDIIHTIPSVLDLSRFHAAPSARLGRLAFESHETFPAEG